MAINKGAPLCQQQPSKCHSDDDNSDIVDVASEEFSETGSGARDADDIERHSHTRFICPRLQTGTTAVRKKNTRGSALCLKPKRHGGKGFVVRMKTNHAVGLGECNKVK